MRMAFRLRPSAPPGAPRGRRRNRPLRETAPRPSARADAPPAAASAAKAVDRRLISGQRVLARCSLELPNHNPFSSYRARRQGLMVMNVRGGSLYLPHQFSEQGARQAFPPGQSSTIRAFTLYPDEGRPIAVGDVTVRYLKLRHGQRLDGLVLRFVGLDEGQLELLNRLPERFPVVHGDEERAISEDALHRL